MPNGTPEALSFQSATPATIAPAESVVVIPTVQGKAPGLLLGYVDGAGNFVVLGSAAGIPVTGNTTLSGLTVASTSTPIHVGDETTATTLIAANASRKGWTIQNNSDADLYVRLGASAATNAFHRRLVKGESMGQRIMDGDLYTGLISGIWAAAPGGFADGGEW